MKRLVFALLTLLVLVIVSPPNAIAQSVEPSPGEARKFYKQGVKYGQLKLYAEAAAAFELAILLKPDYEDAIFNLGTAYSDLGRWQDALKAFRRVIQLNPKDDEAHARIKEINAKLAREQKVTLSAKRVADQKAAPAAEKVSLDNRSQRNPTPPPNSKPRSFSNVNSTPVSSVKSLPPPVVVPRRVLSPRLPTTGPGLNLLAKISPDPTLIPPSLKISSTTPLVNENFENAPPPIPAVKPAEVASVNSDVAIYRVGIGDVLDVRMSDSAADTPTLFTVSAGGLLDYPVLTEPLRVVGLTTEEVGEKLRNELKRLALSVDQTISVAVRDYNSHTILVSGLVNEQGTKILRREAIPLYVVIAEAQPLPEAGRVSIISNEGNKTSSVDLSAPEATGLLIRPGDVVVVQAGPKFFFYIGGDVKEPGEKPYRDDLKLTQAILKAGGLSRESKLAELARDGANGMLEVTIYKLTDIQSGKIPDPTVQPGDRITIVH